MLLLVVAAAFIAARCSRVPAVATIAARGEQVFRQKCADCHGPLGQGVEGKYAGALQGDWSLARLTRYVAQNMPDDDPETLSAPEAQAVAAYMHDAFYSPAAQARLHPARIELAHLTNQQYAIVMADLLRQFAGPDLATATEPTTGGLNATYYSTAQRGRFDATKIVERVIDAGVDFDFSPTSETPRRVGTAEFSVQWRGSVYADETGDHEFTVRTPNTVRAWINAEINAAAPVAAVIDVNVSTPETPDHRVTVRLIGGRSYPLGVDYWALPEKVGGPPPAIALRWKPPHGSERPIPARNLSPAVVRPTFVSTTRFPADDSSQGFERGLSFSKAWDEATTRGAFEVAGHVVPRLDRWAGTRADDPERRLKLEAFAGKFVAAAFRRPLTADETTRYVAEVFRAAPDPETALRRVVLFALKSPQFLYTELPDARPDAARVAARLAWGLWDSLPDAPLAQAAAAGGLRTRAEVAAEATRMLGDPRARAKLREFFHHWLQLRYLEDLRKEPTLHPGFTFEIIDDLRTSLNLFLDEVVWSGASDFRELLRADYLVANERLAGFYGLPSPVAGGFARVPTPPGERAGVLTHPYLLAALSYPKSTSPIHRGVFLTRSIVGRGLKAPPVAVAFNDAEFAPGMSMREKVEKLTRSENCQGCHAVINPLGFSLEWYDAVGRFRREDRGRPIDAVSDYIVDEERTVRLGGARDVAEFAIASEQSNEAFIEQLFHHVVKQPALAYGPDTLPALRKSFIASGYNLQKLMVAIVTLSALHGAETKPHVASRPTPHRPTHSKL